MQLKNNNIEQFIKYTNYCKSNKFQFNPSLKDDYLFDKIDSYKKGSKIKIKKENRGKFTESAKRSGMSVQQFASHVLSNKDKYSTTQIKRANFARNASKWKH